MDENVLAHHGIKGQKWGVRGYQNEDGTLTEAGKVHYGNGNGNGETNEKKKLTPEQKEKIKKAAIITGVAVGVTVAAVMYAKNKDAVDNFVKSNAEKIVSKINPDKVKTGRKTMDSARKTAEYVDSHKSEILKSPQLILRYQDHLSDKEISDAMKKLNQNKALHQLSQDKVKRGANYIQSIAAYGTAATTVYGLLNSPMVKEAGKKQRTDLSDKSDQELRDAINRERLEQQYTDLIINKKK